MSESQIRPHLRKVDYMALIATKCGFEWECGPDETAKFAKPETRQIVDALYEDYPVERLGLHPNQHALMQCIGDACGFEFETPDPQRPRGFYYDEVFAIYRTLKEAER